MWRYRINPSKSCILVFNEKGKTTTQQRTWMLGDEPVRQARQHPHLGIIKSPSPYDPTDHMITRGTHAFYALTGAGAYTGGLLPHHCVRLWKVYCVPRMMYGVAVMRFTRLMRSKLDRSQNQLFKKILGLPNSAADEVVYLLTGLVPLSQHIDMEILLLIGQMSNLPHSRYEVRTVLHALAQPGPLLKTWNDTLMRYQLPDVHALISNPVTYTTWKTKIKRTMQSSLQKSIQQGLDSKTSLSLFQKTIPNAKDMYPSTCTSRILRQAIIVRSQLLSQTYLCQARLNKIKKSTNKQCPICKNGEEDAIHFVASCPPLNVHRQNLLNKLKTAGIPQQILQSFQLSNPQSFTQAVLLPRNTETDSMHRQSSLNATLAFLYDIHSYRTTLLSNTNQA